MSPSKKIRRVRACLLSIPIKREKLGGHFSLDHSIPIKRVFFLWKRFHVHLVLINLTVFIQCLVEISWQKIYRTEVSLNCGSQFNVYEILKKEQFILEDGMEWKVRGITFHHDHSSYEPVDRTTNMSRRSNLAITSWRWEVPLIFKPMTWTESGKKELTSFWDFGWNFQYDKKEQQYVTRF